MFYYLEIGDLRNRMQFCARKRFDGTAYLRGELMIHEPVLYDYEEGEVLYDVVSTGWRPLYLVSDLIINALKQHRITGWESQIAQLFDKNGDFLVTYNLLSVLGRSGPIDFTHGEIVEKQPIFEDAPPYKVRRGFYFDESTWDGSDIFLTGEMSFIFVSQKAKEVIEHSRAKNINLTAQSECECLP